MDGTKNKATWIKFPINAGALHESHLSFVLRIVGRLLAFGVF